jgi:hypothetical protein
VNPFRVCIYLNVDHELTNWVCCKCLLRASSPRHSWSLSVCRQQYHWCLLATNGTISTSRSSVIPMSYANAQLARQSVRVATACLWRVPPDLSICLPGSQSVTPCARLLVAPLTSTLAHIYSVYYPVKLAILRLSDAK